MLLTNQTLKMYYVVMYAGPFGFIKPWTAVRDGETFSQQFLTPSIVEGIEKKIFPELLSCSGIKKIVRHKLTYTSVDLQQEQVQTRGWQVKKKEKLVVRDLSILKRGVLINPCLYLAFASNNDAEIASKQHICLCRNEDVLLPDGVVQTMSEDDFNRIGGFEFRFGQSEQSFMVGVNRFEDCEPMYGWLEIDGKSALSSDGQL